MLMKTGIALMMGLVIVGQRTAEAGSKKRQYCQPQAQCCQPQPVCAPFTTPICQTPAVCAAAPAAPRGSDMIPIQVPVEVTVMVPETRTYTETVIVNGQPRTVQRQVTVMVPRTETRTRTENVRRDIAEAIATSSQSSQLGQLREELNATVKKVDDLKDNRVPKLETKVDKLEEGQKPPTGETKPEADGGKNP